MCEAKSSQSIKVQIPPDREETVPVYFAARKRELPEMIALLAASDFERIIILGQNMKGSGNSYGFPELTQFGVSWNA
jgi:hypothetical protein